MNNSYDLSILIPARNEMWLARTVEDLLKNIRRNTEIIVVLDGEWADPQIAPNERLTIIYNHTSIGQRAATNQACRVSKAKYVMKIDAHCAVDEGFDVKMMSHMQDNYTMVPVMYNLHVFDWTCRGVTPMTGCGWSKYQGPSPVDLKCPQCGGHVERNVLWRVKRSPRSTSFCFDKELHFQYWGDYKRIQDTQGEIVDTMSIQGSCFMMTRDKYWELNICDEEFGSWGQQGVEVACKTWLSGGRVVCNTTTWYSHLFRTQGGDFAFPYPQSGNQIDHARKYSRKQFIDGEWKGAIHNFDWLLEKFRPVKFWHDEKIESPKDKQIIFYTDNRLNLKIAHAVQKQLKATGIPIVSVSLKPMKFGENIYLAAERGYLTMAKQILAGLERATAKYVFFCEHDVLYHPSHFDFTPTDANVYYYNTNVWRVRVEDGHALYCDDLRQLSGLCGHRETLLKHYRERVRRFEEALKNNPSEEDFNKYVRSMGFEPGTHGRPERIDDLPAKSWKSKYPNIDIRHDGNLTPSRWRRDQFRNERYTRGWTEKDVTQLEGWQFLTRDHFYMIL